jgi:hypothetical protein
VAKFAKEQGCKILLNPHLAGWLKYLQPVNTIWDETYYNPEKLKEMADLYNSF